jgi:hypothetical protein
MDTPPKDDTCDDLIGAITDIVNARLAKEYGDLRTIIKIIVDQEFEKKEDLLVISVLKKLNGQLRTQAGARTQ